MISGAPCRSFAPSTYVTGAVASSSGVASRHSDVDPVDAFAVRHVADAEGAHAADLAEVVGVAHRVETVLGELVFARQEPEVFGPTMAGQKRVREQIEQLQR